MEGGEGVALKKGTGRPQTQRSLGSAVLGGDRASEGGRSRFFNYKLPDFSPHWASVSPFLVKWR